MQNSAAMLDWLNPGDNFLERPLASQPANQPVIGGVANITNPLATNNLLPCLLLFSGYILIVSLVRQMIATDVM